MAIFAIGDLHLSLGAEKPMDIFGGWQNYVQRLEDSWRAQVAPGDTVVLAGDTSWAMRLDECGKDFAFLESLPGKKLLVKGNPDYWWTTVAKMQRYLDAQGFASLGFLHNSCALVDGAALCGTRSWMFDAGQPHDEKVMNREKGRLIASLEAAGSAEKIVFLHYPPVCAGAEAREIVEILHAYGVKRCYYGHLHGQALKKAVQGERGGIVYTLISADGVGFRLVPVPVGQPDAPQSP